MKRIRNRDRFGENFIPIQEFLVEEGKKKKDEKDSSPFSGILSLFLLIGPALLILWLIFDNSTTKTAWNIWWITAVGFLILLWRGHIFEINGYRAKNIFGFKHHKKYKIKRLGVEKEVDFEELLVGDLITLDSDTYRVPADIMITEIVGAEEVYSQEYILGNDGLEFEAKHVARANEQENIKIGETNLTYNYGILYGLSYVQINEGCLVKGKVIAVGENLVAYNVLKNNYELERNKK